MSSWREQILRDSEEVITKFTGLYQSIDKGNNELQSIAGPVSEELDHAKLQHETFQKMVNCPINDLLKFGVIDHPRAHNKALITLDYWVDQIEFVLEKIEKIKEETLDVKHQMEQIVLRMSPGFLGTSFTLREANDTIQLFKGITSQGLMPEVTFDRESINNLLACRNFVKYLIEVGNKYFKLLDRLRDE